MNSLFSNQWLEALGWALVHSIWQFALIWLLAAIALHIFWSSAATLRYGITIGMLTLCLLSFIGTFLWQ